MPSKTKKPTLKSKSTKKSPSKLDRVIKKLNLARPRNQFIVAFLVVGVLGGGYFAYQSFAATASWTYTRSNNTLVKSVSTYGACQVNPYNEPQKSYAPVWSLACPNTGKGRAEVSTTSIYLNGSNTALYRLCMTAKGTGKTQLMITAFNLTRSNNFTVNTVNYNRYCGSAFGILNTGSLAAHVDMDTYTGGGWVNVSAITLEKLN